MLLADLLDGVVTLRYNSILGGEILLVLLLQVCNLLLQIILGIDIYAPALADGLCGVVVGLETCGLADLRYNLLPFVSPGRGNGGFSPLRLMGDGVLKLLDGLILRGLAEQSGDGLPDCGRCTSQGILGLECCVLPPEAGILVGELLVLLVLLR